MSYFDHIRAALWGLPIDNKSVSEEELYLHMRQGTGPLVFPLLEMTPQMKAVCVQNMQQQLCFSVHISAN